MQEQADWCGCLIYSFILPLKKKKAVSWWRKYAFKHLCRSKTLPINSLDLETIALLCLLFTFSSLKSRTDVRQKGRKHCIFCVNNKQVIAWVLVQYLFKICPIFSSPKGSENITENFELKKYMPYCTRTHAITSTYLQNSMLQMVKSNHAGKL